MHFDGDPVIMGTEIEVSVVEKGIKMVCNSETESLVAPNVVQNAMCNLFNDISDVRSSVTHQSRNILAMNKRLWRKLTR